MSEKTVFELIHKIEQVTHKTIVKWRQMSKHTLGISHILVLHHLQSYGVSRPSDIAKALHFTPASLTHLSVKLVEYELITRQNAPLDRRITYWEITEEGQQILQTAQADGQTLRAELFSHLTDEEQRTLLHIYSKLDDAY